MAPSKSAKRLKLDQAFTKVDRENFYRCKLCSKDLEGLKDINFVTGATRHIDSKHSSFWKDDSTQSVISFNGNVTDRREHQRLNAAFQFAKTSLPINIFRDESCRKFLSTLQQLPSLPDYRTVQNDLRSLEKKSVDRLKDATHYGVQLDHWTDFNRNSILVVIVSFITDSFIHVVQVIDFKVVPSQKALVTANTLEQCLRDNQLDPKMCLAYQSDNCNAMIASCKIFQKNVFEDHEAVETDEIEDISEECFTVAGEETVAVDIESIGGNFVGCGAHRLNLILTEATSNCQFFKQINCFCKIAKGPNLSDTRWYGHYNQVAFAKKNQTKLQEVRNTNYLTYSELDEKAVNDMHDVLTKLKMVGKCFESQSPITDTIVNTVKKLNMALNNVSRMDSIHQTVRNFCVLVVSYMGKERRFKCFPDVLYGAALLNPSKLARSKLTDNENEKGYLYLKTLADSHQMVIHQAEESDPEQVPEISDLDKAFEIQTEAETSLTLKKFGEEYRKFQDTVNSDDTAFEFFKNARQEWPFLSKLAQYVLGVLPSPAVAERVFSKAGYLSAGRRNRILTENVKTRLIVQCNAT